MPALTNSLKNLSVTATPKDHINGAVTWGKWENQSHTVTLMDNGQPVNPNLDIFMPETEYQLSASGTDSYDYSVDINFTGGIDTFLTRNDCPAFSNLFIGSLKSSNDGEDIYEFTENSAVTVTSNLTGETVPKWTSIGGNKNFLNNNSYCFDPHTNNSLTNMNFEAHGLIDFTDTNIYDPELVLTEDNFDPAKYDSDFFKNHYLYVEDPTHRYLPKNIFIPKKPTIIGFDVFNKALGIHKISANGGVLNTINDTVESHSIITERGEDSLYAYKISGTNIGTLDDLFLGEAVNNIPEITDFQDTGNKIYACKSTQDNHICMFIGNQGQYSGSYYDTVMNSNLENTLSISTISKCRKGNSSQVLSNASRSTLSIPFYVYFPPQIDSCYSDDTIGFVPVGVPTIDGNTKIKGVDESYLTNRAFISKTTIRFCGNRFINTAYEAPVQSDYAKYGFHFDVTTNKWRPFLPLFNYKFDTDESIIGNESVSTFIDNRDGDPYFFKPVDEHDYTRRAFLDPHRMTSLVVEALFDTREDQVNQTYTKLYPHRMTTYNSFTDTDERMLDITNINETIEPYFSDEAKATWGSIGASPTRSSLSSSVSDAHNFLEDYFISQPEFELNRTGMKNPSSDAFTSYRPMNIGNSTPIDSGGPNMMMSWPIGIPRFDQDHEVGADCLTSLIPDSYYFFRVTAANFCGTTSKIFAIRTLDVDPPEFQTQLMKTSQSSGQEINLGTINSSNKNETFNNGNPIPVDNTTYFEFWADDIRNGWEGDPNWASQTQTKNCTIHYQYKANVEDSWGPEVKIPIEGVDYHFYVIGVDHYFYPFAPGNPGAGYYKFIIRSNKIRYANSYDVWHYQRTHTYYVNVTEDNELQAITEGNTPTSITSRQINGRYNLTGQHSLDGQDPAGFEWGLANPDSPISSIPATTIVNNTFNATLSNLSPTTGYRYRAWAKSTDANIGKVYGEWQYFTTENVVTATITVSNETRTGVNITVN